MNLPLTLCLVNAVVLAPAVWASAPVSGKATSRCARNAIRYYVDMEARSRDPWLGLIPTLSGQESRSELLLGGNPIQIFRWLGDGNYGNAYLGLWDSSTVVIKIAKDAAPSMMVEREVSLTHFLERYGFSVAPILKYFKADRTIIKPYIRGFTLATITELNKQKMLSDEQFKEAKARLALIQHQLTVFKNGKNYGAWCAAHQYPVMIDTDPENFILQDGRWIFFDP